MPSDDDPQLPSLAAITQSLIEELENADPQERLYALRWLAENPVADERVLAACEVLLEDRTIAVLGRPYRYGEVRGVAADAVAAVRAVLGRPSPVVLEDAMIVVISVRALADAAGIAMEHGANGVEASVKTLERLALLGKIPRRRVAR